MTDKGLTYRDAGVDIDEGDALVERIKPHARRTLRPEVLAGIGGFGGLFEVPKGYREPVLVAGTDGVGTKLKLAFGSDRHETVGIDLVAMSVNDVVVCGAEPVVFLDYFATSRLRSDQAARVIAGIPAGRGPARPAPRAHPQLREGLPGPAGRRRRGGLGARHRWWASREPAAGAARRASRGAAGGQLAASPHLRAAAAGGEDRRCGDASHLQLRRWHVRHRAPGGRRRRAGLPEGARATGLGDRRDRGRFRP